MSEDATIISFSGALTIAGAQELRHRLLAVLSGARAIVVDCTQATQVDTSFVQILLAARKSAERDGIAFSVLAGDDSPLRGVCLALGLANAWGGEASAPP